jgi:23S rRNA (adenine2030-N6)-methyltransferase
MNYRHIYHAGNFADVVKHLTLVSILNNLLKKDKPFAVLDAFAGLGVYDLSSEMALKTAEYSNGIRLLLNCGSNIPELMTQYIKIVKSAGAQCYTADTSKVDRKTSGELAEPTLVGEQKRIPQFDEANLEVSKVYPGSPWIINSLLRQNDRLIASELHPQDYAHLRHLFIKNKQVAVHHLDAYNAIKAFVPFKENRGLVLIDPPFEVKDEFDKVIESLKIIAHRAANICTMVWYPIKDQRLVSSFYQKSSELGNKEVLLIEFELKMLNSQGLSKCGLLITNPPFIKDEIEQSLSFIKTNIYNGKAEFSVELRSSS